MIKQMFAVATLFAVMMSAWAAVNVNTANGDALRGIKGIGEVRAQAILAERDTHGPYKDAADLAKRVKGLGGQTVERLQAEGLTIGSAKSAVPQATRSPARRAGAK